MKIKSIFKTSKIFSLILFCTFILISFQVMAQNNIADENIEIMLMAKIEPETMGVINGTRIWLRSAPNLNSETLESLNVGHKLIIIGKSSEQQVIGNRIDYWYKVQPIKCSGGWVYGAFVDILNNENTHIKPIAENITRLLLVDAISLALAYNEDIQESFGRVIATESDIKISKGVYDLNAYSTTHYSSFDNLKSSDYEINNLRNATTSYLNTDTGLRQRVPSGGMVSMFYTHSHENMLGELNQKSMGIKNYLTVEFVQSLLKGIGDKVQRGAIKKAMLAVEESEESKKIVVSQITLEVIRAYWILDIAYNNLKVANEILVMAKELYRREGVRVSQGISQGVDYERARLVMEQRKYTVVQFERDFAISQERLKLLINAPKINTDTHIIPITQPIHQVKDIPNRDKSCQIALNNRYELKQLAVLLAQLDIDYDVNSNNLLPVVDLNVGITTSNGNDYIRSATNFNDTNETGSWFVGITVSFPIQNREARGSLEKTEKLIDIAMERISKTERTIQAEVRESLYNFVMAKEGIPVVQRAYESALLTMQGETKRFEMGGVNNSDLLISYDALGREEINLHVAIINYNMALAEYQLACGTLLDKYQISTNNDEARMTLEK